MSQWYLMYNGQQVGPMSKEQLKAYGLTPDSMVWKEGMPQWAQAFTIPELMQLINAPQQPYHGPGVQSPGGQVPPPSGMNAVSEKDHVVAGILAILLGAFGAQYFYIGKTQAGLICLGITLVSWVLTLIIIGVFLAFVWGIMMLVQGIMILCMTQQQFNQKYVNTSSQFPLF